MDSKLRVGNKAHDFRFETPWGDRQSFYEAAEGKPAVLVFLRYLGCPICQNDMANLKREIGLIKGRGAKLFVVLQSSPDTVSSVTSKEDWPFTIITDPRGELFKLYGVEPGGIIKYLHPAGLISAIRATMQGYRHGKFEGHETQLPAVFIVGKDSMIKFAHYGRHLSDIPAPAAVAANI
ncbi:MAG TPA: peroxiredoxin-like family protein [Deltaproteobacteria bacterium]|jgi:peroxiredoxin|nr:peroxiredoxin-like family protein [Deltaproteobacteria bacterium]HQI01652.1 peroxiredoxin-like family protein [Deltaproteobacteria bacterium]